MGSIWSKVKRGFRRKETSPAPEFLWNSVGKDPWPGSKDDLDLCGVCFNQMVTHERNCYLLIRCAHTFHIECLRQKIEKTGGKECPLCKSEIEAVSNGTTLLSWPDEQELTGNTGDEVRDLLMAEAIEICEKRIRSSGFYLKYYEPVVVNECRRESVKREQLKKLGSDEAKSSLGAAEAVAGGRAGANPA